MSPLDEVRLIGRYALHEELASGGMAAVHLGRLLGPVGFARTVAIKRLHSHHARDPEFVGMFLDEARIVARIKHPNVVPTLDVVALEGELFLVMEYVHGVPVSKVMMALGKSRERMPVNVAVGICVGVLEGLHAAHEAKSEDGAPLHIVHRDVSPQNVIVGADGIARVLDFGIAKASERLQTTEDGSFKGKLGYMPPDVLSGAKVDRRADLWGTAVVLWEMLVGKRLFSGGESPHALVRAIVEGEIDPPSKRGVAIPPALESVLLRALAKQPEERYATARDMASALEESSPVASSRVIGEWLTRIVGPELEARAARVEQMERSTRAAPPSIGTMRTFTESGGSPSLPLIEAGHGSQSGSNPRFSLPQGAPFESISASHGPFGTTVPAPPSRKPLVVALSLSLLLAAGAIGVIVFMLRRPAAIGGTGAGATSITSPPPTPTPPPDPSSTAAAIPAGTASSSPIASSSAAKPPASSVKVAPARTGGATPKSCNPPYTIGPPPDYIRKPKLECLQH